MGLPEPSIDDLQLRTNLEALDSRLAALDGGSVGVGGGLATTGDLKASLATANHDGWLLCDGTSYNTADYPNLGALLGGGSTFNVPDLKDRAPYGAGTKALKATDGNTVGNRGPDHQLTEAEMPAHTHGMNMTRGLNVAGGGGGTSGYLWHDSGSVATGSKGGSGSHNHGYYIVNFFIKT